MVDVVPNLGIEIDQQHLSNVSNISDTFFKRLLKNTKNILVFLLLIKWYHVHGFGLDQRSLIAMYAYLNNRVQATKVGSCYGKILDICFGIPQGSTFSTRFFYINIIDFVLAEHYRSFFTPYICGNTF